MIRAFISPRTGHAFVASLCFCIIFALARGSCGRRRRYGGVFGWGEITHVPLLRSDCPIKLRTAMGRRLERGTRRQPLGRCIWLRKCSPALLLLTLQAELLKPEMTGRGIISE